VSAIGVRARLRGRDVGRGAQRTPGGHRAPRAVPDARARGQPGRIRTARRTVGVTPAAAAARRRRHPAAATAAGPRGRRARVRHAQVGGPVAVDHASGRVLPAEHVQGRRVGRGGAPVQHAARVLGGKLRGGDQRGGQLRQPVLHRVRQAHMRRPRRHLRHGHGRRLSSDQRGRPDGRHGQVHQSGAPDAGRRPGHGRAEDGRPAVAARRARRRGRYGAHEELRVRGRRGPATAATQTGRGGHHGPVRALHHEPVAGAHPHVSPTVADQRGSGDQDHGAPDRGARSRTVQAVPERPTRRPPSTPTPHVQQPSGARQTTLGRPLLFLFFRCKHTSFISDPARSITYLYMLYYYTYYPNTRTTRVLLFLLLFLYCVYLMFFIY